MHPFLTLPLSTETAPDRSHFLVPEPFCTLYMVKTEKYRRIPTGVFHKLALVTHPIRLLPSTRAPTQVRSTLARPQSCSLHHTQGDKGSSISVASNRPGRQCKQTRLNSRRQWEISVCGIEPLRERL